MHMELYQRGYNDVQIASELELAKNTVGRWRKRNGLPTQNAMKISGTDRVIEGIKDNIIELYFKSYSDYKIGQILNIPVKTVNRWRVQNKLPVASITSQDKVAPLEKIILCTVTLDS
jgi:transposase-like protein